MQEVHTTVCVDISGCDLAGANSHIRTRDETGWRRQENAKPGGAGAADTNREIGVTIPFVVELVQITGRFAGHPNLCLEGLWADGERHLRARGWCSTERVLAEANLVDAFLFNAEIGGPRTAGIAEAECTETGSSPRGRVLLIGPLNRRTRVDQDRRRGCDWSSDLQRAGQWLFVDESPLRLGSDHQPHVAGIDTVRHT